MTSAADAGARSSGDPPPRVAIVGAGRAGTSLAASLVHAGWPTGLATRDASGRELALALGASWLGATVAPSDGFDRAPIVVLAVRDAQIEPLARTLAARGTWEGRVAFHLSGSQPSSLLRALSDAGASVASLHPLASLQLHRSREITAIPSNTWFFAEGDPAALAVAGEIAAAVDGELHVLGPDRKPLYHAAATIAGNLVATLHAAGSHALRTAGVERAEEALLPLAIPSVVAVAGREGLAGLTGPVARGDVQTLAANVDALRNMSPALRRAHAAVSLLALELLESAGVVPAQRAEMEALLRAVLAETTPSS